MEAGCSTCIKGQVLRSSGNHDGRLYIKRIVSFAATDKQEPIASPTSDTPVLQETEGSTGDPPTSGSSSYFTERGVGKPGFISFQGNSSQTRSVESVPHPGKEAFRVVWFVGPTILVAFLVLPSLTCAKYSELFEDSLLTVTTMVLSLIILFLTMGMVWPWTGPGASATLAPYLIGLVVQFSFEQYARHRKSPSWPVIPIIFKANRQSNSLIGGTTFTLISYALSPMTDVGLFQRALLTVLQILGIICVWSLLSFLVRFLPSSDIPDP